MRIVLVVHYYPPINSSGAKRAEALSKYLVALGHEVTVITPRKYLSDGEFTETVPAGVRLIELSSLGRAARSLPEGERFESMYSGRPSWRRQAKDRVMAAAGQLPDPRLPFAIAFASPWLDSRAQETLRSADIVIASAPPWPMLLAAILTKRRFGAPCILDYRDQFSECHEMPGGRFAKRIEKLVDAWLVKTADHVVTISEPMATYYRSLVDAVSVIPNGFDPDVMERARTATKKTATEATQKIVIRYMGLVSPGRVPHRVLTALTMFQAEQPKRFAQLRLEFYGSASLVERVLASDYPSIRAAFAFFPAVSYETSIQRILEADYLLFAETSSTESLSAQGILTTKLFEYIGSGRPVLADISPHTLAGSLLANCGSDHVISDTFEVFLEAFRNPGFLTRKPDHFSSRGEGLSRRAQAEEYAQLAIRDGRQGVLSVASD